MEYLCHIYTRICSVCHTINRVLYSEVTYYGIFNKSTMPGATGEAGYYGIFNKSTMPGATGEAGTATFPEIPSSPPICSRV